MKYRWLDGLIVGWFGYCSSLPTYWLTPRLEPLLLEGPSQLTHQLAPRLELVGLIV